MTRDAEKDAPYVEVITRYGGFRHLAETGLLPRVTGHLFTLCRTTSAWTIDSWRVTPDHPLGLTPEAMERLPLCADCQEEAAANRSRRHVIPPAKPDTAPDSEA